MAKPSPKSGAGLAALRGGQAMLETVLAVMFVTFLLLVSFRVVQLLTAKILLDHAAARAARARAVGLNDFMCEKSARVAMIPAAGKRTWPYEYVDEVARVPLYLQSEMPATARGILDYKWWDTTDISITDHSGIAPSVDADVMLWTDDYKVRGDAAIESHYQLYMNEF